MKRGKTIALWALAVFFILSALVFFPSLSSLFALIFVCLIIPISNWQNILVKFIRSKLKVIIAIALALLTIFTAPTTDIDDTTDIVPTTTTEYTSTPTTQSTSDLPTAPATEPTTTPTTDSTTTPTTEPPHTHNFSAATCTTPKTCSCGATEGEANGHIWKDATYTSPKTCTTCGITDGNPRDVPGKENYHGHVYTGGDSSTKYHYEANCAGKYSHEITWDEVERRGLDPCGNCVLN